MINLSEFTLLIMSKLFVNSFTQMSLFRNFQSFPCQFVLPPSSANTVMKDDLLNKIIFKNKITISLDQKLKRNTQL